MDTELIAATHDRLADNLMSDALFRLRAACFNPDFLAEHIQAHCEPPQGSVSVLDVGSNQGHKTNLILNTVSRLGGDVSHLLGIDVSPVCVERATQKNSKPNVSYRVADFLKKDSINEPFDYIFLFAIWHHIADTRLAVERIRDVLAPGGVVLVLNGFYPENSALQIPAVLLQRLYRYVECRGAIPYDKPVVSNAIAQFEAGGFDCRTSFRTNFPTNVFNTHALAFQAK